jgi:methylthioribose-1-phosphate isomerase
VHGLQIDFWRDSTGRPHLRVLDQLRLPFETVFVDVRGVDDAWGMIRKMGVRGAPVSA